jgi:hypothetical protein
MNQPKHYLAATRLRDRYGISAMTEWRWLHDEALGLPKPVLIQGRKYYDLGEIELWERRRAALSGKAAS